MVCWLQRKPDILYSIKPHGMEDMALMGYAIPFVYRDIGSRSSNAPESLERNVKGIELIVPAIPGHISGSKISHEVILLK